MKIDGGVMLEKLRKIIYEKSLEVYEKLLATNKYPFLLWLFETSMSNYEELNTYTPEEILIFLMETRGCKKEELAPILGGELGVVAVLKGRRKLTGKQIRDLAKYFNVSVETFVGGR